ncbi:MAG: uracil-DNA glycosylase [Limnohabitans sp.]
MSDPTRFDLDDRQRAMLAEMGVRVWWPSTPAEPAAQAMPAAPAPEAAPAVASTVAPMSAATTAPMTASTAAAPAVVPRPPQAASVRPAVSPVPVLTTRPLADGVDRMDWTTLQETAAACQACDLCAQRKKSVFGVGDQQAQWMVIGEAPGEQEDLQGEPFVGQSGQLLDNMLKAVGLSRQAQGEGGVYIANAIKCRPPGNHNPTPQELATCAPYLARQVALVQPQIILLMGRFAVQSVLQTTEPIGKLRGQVHTYQGVPVVVTYHPAYLLRNPADKAKAWADLVLALKTAQG